MQHLNTEKQVLEKEFQHNRINVSGTIGIIKLFMCGVKVFDAFGLGIDARRGNTADVLSSRVYAIARKPGTECKPQKLNVVKVTFNRITYKNNN